ncbi:MAG: FliA/WhiG family RNA polymerase sigma factor [Pseudomonadota bacterium]
MITPDTDLRKQEAEQYLPFVRKIANRIARRLPSSVDVDDLIGAGTVGLMEALERYNPVGGRSFETYAEFRVKGAIFDELRRNDPLNRAARNSRSQIESKTAELTSELGRPPETEEVAAAMNTTVEKYLDTAGRVQALRVVSLSTPGMELENPNSSQEEEIGQQQLIDLVRGAIEKLPERQQMVLNLYYVDGLNQQQVGEVLGVSESRISQILSEVTRRLRKLVKDGMG